MTIRDHGGADITDRKLLELRLREAGDDPVKLRALGQLLEDRAEPWVRVIRLKIAGRLVAASRSTATRAGSLSALCSRLGLPLPDGRWLHMYRLADGQLSSLAEQAVAAIRAGRIEADYQGAAAFVLWASEWLRRYHPGGMLRWEDIEQALGASLTQDVWREVTSRGLGVWGRPVIKSHNTRLFLSTLAREGGFPAAAVQQGGRSWAAEILQAIVSGLLGSEEPGEQEALRLAHEYSGFVPVVFSDEDFLLLCADLAMAIVELRRAADEPARQAGIPTSAWLDANRPDWLERLPIRVDSPAAAALLGRLMQVKPRTVAGGLGARRVLKRGPSGWQVGARFYLGGEVRSGTRPQLEPSLGRLRAFASGSMARWVTGELARLDSPAGDGIAWTSRPAMEDGVFFPVPADVPLELELRAEDRAKAQWLLAGGGALRSGILVGRITQEDHDGPLEVEVLGGASGTLRREEFALLVPAGWAVQPTAPDEEVVWLGRADGDCAVWKVVGGCVATDPTGDCYRFLGRQAADRFDRIELIGSPPGIIQPPDGVDLFSGPPIVRLERGGSGMPPGGRLFLRRHGHPWEPAGSQLPSGSYELGWREGGLLRDRRTIAVLPVTAAIELQRRPGRVFFRLDGWKGAQLRPCEGAPVVAAAGGWASLPTASLRRSFGALVDWSDAGQAPLEVSIPFPCGAGLARWSEDLLRPGQTFSLWELNEIVAFSDGPMRMFARMYDERGLAVRGTDISWTFDGQLPLSQVAPELAGMLLPSNVGSRIQLGMHDGIEDYWFVSPFEAALVKTHAGYVSSKGMIEPGTQLCGRRLAAPHEEVVLQHYSLAEDSNHRPIDLAVDGEWLIYLRHGPRVLTAPVAYPSVGGQAGGSTHATIHRQMGADAGRPQEGGDGDRDGETVALLVGLVASLDGLPPASFPQLAALPGLPRLLAQMVLSASNAERSAVLSLEEGLPFLWCTIPREEWRLAEDVVFHGALRRLKAERVYDGVERYALEMLISAKLDLVERYPLLSAVLSAQGDVQPIEVIAQRFLNRSVDNIRDTAGSVFREELGSRLPDYFLRLPAHCLETLDAPCAAAYAAAGQWVPDIDHIRRIKAVAGSFPNYFAEAFAASLALS